VEFGTYREIANSVRGLQAAFRIFEIPLHCQGRISGVTKMFFQRAAHLLVCVVPVGGCTGQAKTNP
jgi:hypothetical protein